MSEENKAIFINRFKSLLWRIGTMIGAVVVAFISDNIGLFELPLWAVGILGLILGEITKWLNTAQK